MKVQVSIDAVVLHGLPVPAAARAALLAQLEAQVAGQLTAALPGLPAHPGRWPAEAITAPVRAAVTTALGRPPATGGG